MTSAHVRTRFAPSPTGELHLGNARTALFSWLYARRQGGRFILRSEDTDADRSRPAHLDGMLESLRWLGLDWDEGPDRDGGFGPYRQSARQDRYQACLQQLLAADQVYPCFCSREELAEARRRQVAAGRPPRYPGTCAALSADEQARRRGAGRPEVLRLRVPATGAVCFDDLVHGAQRVALGPIGDFVVTRADGSPTFLFANAVDDALMEISHVLRGEDHLANTPRQLLLLGALGLSPPSYGHLPLVLGEGGRPLAKREGAVPLAELRAAGYLPEAVVNHLARIGYTPQSDALLDAVELAARFDLARVGRASARHDPQALLHWQRLAIARFDDEAFWRWLAQARPADAVDPPVSGARFAHAVRANVLLPADGWRWARVLFAPEVEPDAAAAGEIEGAGAAFFEHAATVDTSLARGDFRAWVAGVGAATGCRGRTLYRPLRAALTGSTEGPELHEVVALMPPELVRQRLCRAARHAAGAAASRNEPEQR